MGRLQAVLLVWVRGAALVLVLVLVLVVLTALV